MKATFENDMERGRGYARLRLGEVDGISAGNWRFSLCRASDQTYLGRSGWQNSEDLIEPETYTSSGQELTLRIGPSVVDYLDVNENYRVSLSGEGIAPQRAVLAITSLNSSMMGATDKLAAAQPKPVPAPAPAPEPKPEPAPQPDPEPEPELLPEPPAPAPAKSSLPLILLVLLLLGAAAGGAWWYMNQKSAPGEAKTETPAETAKADKPEPKPEPAKAEEPKKETPKAEAPKTEEPKAEAPKPEPAKPAPAAPASARDQVRQFFGGTPSGQAAVDLYAKLPATSPEEQDAAYRLLLYAAEEGQEKAYLPLARSTDPTTPAFGSISKDGAEAWAWYAKAAPTNPEAAQALQNLKTWLETEAGKGNQKAVDWINKIAAAAAKK